MLMKPPSGCFSGRISIVTGARAFTSRKSKDPFRIFLLYDAKFPRELLKSRRRPRTALSEATRRADALSSEITGRLLSQERRTNDPPGCPDSLRTTTLCSRERSWHERRFRASVSRTARPGVGEGALEGTWGG